MWIVGCGWVCVDFIVVVWLEWVNLGVVVVVDGGSWFWY